MVEYWIEEYDWRDVERRMNELPQFTVDLMGVPLHFIHVKGKGPNPMPLLLHHGWPWTFWDVRKVIGPLTDPAAHGGDPADSFDVVLISLPGYGFSSPLTETGWNWWHTADLENALMKDVLGYERYATAGGDWGALVAQQHGHKYEQDVYRRLHALPRADEPLPPGAPGQAAPTVEFDPVLGLPAASEYSDGEKGWFERGKLFVENESGYGEIQLTKPQTLAALVADSPPASSPGSPRSATSGAWRSAGSAPRRSRSVWPKEDLVTTAAVYFLTNTGGTSSRYYWECRRQSLAALARPVPGGRRADGGRASTRARSTSRPDHLHREVLQPPAVPRARRRRALRAARGARHLRRRRLDLLPHVPLTVGSRDAPRGRPGPGRARRPARANSTRRRRTWHDTDARTTSGHVCKS